MLKTIEDYFDDIDVSRSRRARELSEISAVFGVEHEISDSFGIRSKALIVLSYAVWERFYNECVDIYCDFLISRDKVVSEVSWRMLIGVLKGEFDSLHDRGSSLEARKGFVENIRDKQASKFGDFHRQVIMARSNLNWDKLSYNFAILDFDLKPLEKHRIRLDKEVVGWRHSVAHGSEPELGKVDAVEHTALVAEIMLLVADTFQAGMLRHI